jgi:Fur family peroxide stress response transcriptional regulator
MITKMTTIKRVLEASGLKPTYPRLKILQYLEKHENHPTVEMIYEDLVKEIPTISKTTIYNTLNAFVEKGIVHAVSITGTETRYDVKEGSHHHLLCKGCGRIFDVEVHCPYEQQIVVNGHRIEEKLGYFKGTCKDCLEKEE